MGYVVRREAYFVPSGMNIAVLTWDCGVDEQTSSNDDDDEEVIPLSK